MEDPRSRLKNLIEDASPGEQWIPGRTKAHSYKRISIDEEERDRLASLGGGEIWCAYGKKPYYTQAVIAGAMLSGDYDKISVITCWQYGKLIADDEPVLTSGGWKNHGDLVVGDRVVSPEGKFVPVLAVSPKGEANRVVHFSNGDSVKCHAKHEWVAQTTGRRSKPKVYETDEIRSKLGTWQDFMIPHRKPLEGEEKDLVDPYTFGAWLGDGTTTQGVVCAHPADRSVLDRCRKAYPNGAEWVHKTTGVISANLNGLAADLSRYDLCFQRKDTRKKYIPEEYLTASITQRLELLAGLIDTDGYRDKKGRYYFTTSVPTLRDGVKELVSTFGWRFSCVEVQPRLSSSGIQGKHPYWVIGFNVSMPIPCELERKKTSRTTTCKRISIESIDECEPVSGNCIQVEGGVYCVGRHLIPTHNSWLMGHVAPLLARRGIPTFVAANNTDLTTMIMSQVYAAIKEASDEHRAELMGVDLKKAEKLGVSLSRQRIGYACGGSVEAITLGGTYQDTAHNKALGKGGAYIIDEAALVPETVYAETLRSNFARTDNKKYLQVAISNPHQPGWFYDDMTAEDSERHLIVWMDIRSAIEDGRWTKTNVLAEAERMRQDEIQRYLLCELPESGMAMFDAPVVGEAKDGMHFLGVDAAYKGKDSICLCDVVQSEGYLYAKEITHINPKQWIDGETTQEIVDQIARVARLMDVALVCVDEGWGVWLKMGLEERGIPVKGINFGSQPTKERKSANQYSATNAFNLRAEMHLDIQDLMTSQHLIYSEQVLNQVKDVLPLITSKRNTSGKIQIRPKQEIKNELKKSPDEFDSLMLGVHAAILYNAEF